MFQVQVDELSKEVESFKNPPISNVTDRHSPIEVEGGRGAQMHNVSAILSSMEHDVGAHGKTLSLLVGNPKAKCDVSARWFSQLDIANRGATPSHPSPPPPSPPNQLMSICSFSQRCFDQYTYAGCCTSITKPTQKGFDSDVYTTKWFSSQCFWASVLGAGKWSFQMPVCSPIC